MQLFYDSRYNCRRNYLLGRDLELARNSSVRKEVMDGFGKVSSRMIIGRRRRNRLLLLRLLWNSRRWRGWREGCRVWFYRRWQPFLCAFGWSLSVV